MGRIPVYSTVFLIIILLLMSPVYTQIKDSNEIDFYQAFGEEYDFAFLKNIGKDIDQALLNRKCKSLGAYSALFFYAENISGKKLPELTGLQLLEEATRIATEIDDRANLLYLANIWEEPFLGAGNAERARSIRDSVQKTMRIKIEPLLKQITEGETIAFKVCSEFDTAIPISDLNFKARYGTFLENQYRSPMLSNKDSMIDFITITYNYSGKSEYAIVNIKKPDSSKTWIKLEPGFKQIAEGETIFFRVLNELDKDVSLADVTFKATYGSFSGAQYQPPYLSGKENVTDTIVVTHKYSGQKAFATVSIKRSEMIVLPSPSPAPIQSYTKDKPPATAGSLTREEYARLNASENLVFWLEKAGKAISDGLNLNVTLKFSREILVGVQLSEAYIYKESPGDIRVTASISVDSAREMIKRRLERQNIFLTQKEWDRILFPGKKIEVEGRSR